MNARFVSRGLRASRAVTVLPHYSPSHSMLAFAAQRRTMSSTHAQETFEGFTNRYVSFFQSVEDLFELQRGLNNCFAHDLVPAPSVIEAALRAARRVDDYATAVRIFEGIKEKVENREQYKAYLEELKGVREELDITTKEELYPSS